MESAQTPPHGDAGNVARPRSRLRVLNFIRLASGILERDGALLLVASRYANHAEPLWNLPGGRARVDESFAVALAREFREETGLAIAVRGLRYLSESFDPVTQTRFVNATFEVEAIGDADDAAVPKNDAHVVDVAWVARERLAERISVAVVREPLSRNLEDPMTHRYFAFADAGITIQFADPA